MQCGYEPGLYDLNCDRDMAAGVLTEQQNGSSCQQIIFLTGMAGVINKQDFNSVEFDGFRIPGRSLETLFVVRNPPQITVFPPEYALKTAGFRPPQETTAIAFPVADLPSIGPTYAGNGKNGHFRDRIQGEITRYFSKMAPYSRLSDGTQIRAFCGVFREGKEVIRGRIGRIWEVGGEGIWEVYS